MPYQSRGARVGAVAVTTAWTRSAMARSGSGISAIFASTSRSASAAFSAGEPRRAAFLVSRAWSFIAARSSAVNPSYVPSAWVMAGASLSVVVLGGGRAGGRRRRRSSAPEQRDDAVAVGRVGGERDDLELRVVGPLQDDVVQGDLAQPRVPE